MTARLSPALVPEIYRQPHGERLISLQVLRGLAACIVVFHHVSLAQTSYGGRSSWIAQSGFGLIGASGVDLFFIISGFIMMYSSSRESGSDAARAFLIRRFRRIFPLYWIWTTLLLSPLEIEANLYSHHIQTVVHCMLLPPLASRERHHVSPRHRSWLDLNLRSVLLLHLQLDHRL